MTLASRDLSVRQALPLHEQALPHRSLGSWVLYRRLQLHAIP